MSNSQWPGQQPSDSNPWSRQDSSWAGPQFSDAPGRDPRQPFGQQAPRGYQPQIEDFQEEPKPKSNRSVTLVFAAILAVAALVVGLQIFGGGDDMPGEGETESAAPRITYDPTSAATSSTEGKFDQNGSGTFELISSSWNGDTLDVEYRITVDNGTQSFSLYLFSNDTLEAYNPVEVVNDTVAEGEPHVGTASFRLPRAEATLILTSLSGRALTAINVPG